MEASKKGLSEMVITVSCFAELQADGQWYAFCVDYDLVVQGETFDDVRERLEAQISSYVGEALGEHSAYQGQLLSRRAPDEIVERYERAVQEVARQNELAELRGRIAALEADTRRAPMPAAQRVFKVPAVAA